MVGKYRQQIRDSFYTSIVVGILLVFINHTEAILSLSFSPYDMLHWSLNFVVPFMVSLYSRVAAVKRVK